jgi:hypothetical protein
MEVLMGKSSINGPFSMAMLNNQMVSFFDFQGFAPEKNVDFHHQEVTEIPAGLSSHRRVLCALTAADIQGGVTCGLFPSQSSHFRDFPCGFHSGNFSLSYRKFHHASFMSKSTISIAMFNSFWYVYQRVYRLYNISECLKIENGIFMALTGFKCTYVNMPIEYGHEHPQFLESSDEFPIFIPNLR